MLSTNFFTETTIIRNVFHYVHQIPTNMRTTVQETVCEHARLDHTPMHKQDSESASLPVHHTTYSRTIQQTDALASVRRIHSCSQISQFTNAFINVKTQIGLLTTKPKHVPLNALPIGSSGASVFSTLASNFAQTDILQTFSQTENATSNAHLHDSQTNGLQLAWYTAAKSAKITTKTSPQEQGSACRYVQVTASATIPIRPVNQNKQSPYIRHALLSSTPTEPPNCASSNAPLAPLLTKLRDIVRSDALAVTMPILPQGSALLDVLPTTLAMSSAPLITRVFSSVPQHTTLKTLPSNASVNAPLFINSMLLDLVKAHVLSLSLSTLTLELKTVEPIARRCLQTEPNDNASVPVLVPILQIH
jgi:hypothetical protein